MDSDTIKKQARELGADLVGIVSGDRLFRILEQIEQEAKDSSSSASGQAIGAVNTTGEFESQPRQFGVERRSPHFPFVGSGSGIVIGHRVLRGALRGVEEGTNFSSTFGMFGKGWSEKQFVAKTVFDLVSWLEKNGIEANPVLGTGFDIAKVACAAGLGMIGRGGFFLSPQYGHRQRLALIFTDVEFESDVESVNDLCAGCRACIDACPLGAFSGSDCYINMNVCLKCHNGALQCPDQYPPVDRIAAACGRACMVALENRITNRFVEGFRKRPVWWSDINEVMHVVGGNGK